MARIIERVNERAGSLTFRVQVSILIDTNDHQVAGEIVDFLGLVHGQHLYLGLSKGGGYYAMYRGQTEVNLPATRVASWLYGVPVTAAEYF